MFSEHPVTTVITALPLPQGWWSAALGSEFLVARAGSYCLSLQPHQRLSAQAMLNYRLLNSAGAGGGGGTALLKLQCAGTSPRELVKMQILTQQVCAWREVLHLQQRLPQR